MRFRWVSFCCVTLFAATAQVHAETGQHLLESKESLYNNIYVYQQGNFVSLTFGYNRRLYTESISNTQDDRDLPVSYTRLMTLGTAYTAKLERVLEIGFGGGRTSWYLHRFLPDVQVTSVELDPAVLAMAKKYFGIKDEPNFNVATSDGRTFLKNSTDHYDIIIIDAYRGPFVPFHLLTKEFYTLVKSHLAEGGVVVQNIEPTTMLFDSATLTINSVFPNLDIYPAEGNAVSIAYDGPALSTAELQQKADARQATYKFRYELGKMLSDRRPFKLSGNTMLDKNAKVLTDDFAPVESLKAIEEHNRKWPDR